MRNNTKKTVFITGATGFVGSHLTRRLVREGFDVHILIRSKSNISRLENIDNNITKHYCDLGNYENLKNILVLIKPIGIFHLAASVITSGVRDNDQDVLNSNFLGTMNLINASNDINYSFFINTGTFLSYGIKSKAVKELDVCEPPELYSLVKLGGELYGQAIAREKNKPIVSFRLFTPYGPDMKQNSLVSSVVKNALKGDKINLTEATVTRDFIFIEDVVNLYMEAMGKCQKNKGEIFNVGSGTKTNLKQFLDYVLKLSHSESTVQWNTFPPVFYDNGIWEADMGKTFSHFNWRPNHTLEEGLKKTIDWMNKNNKV